MSAFSVARFTVGRAPRSRRYSLIFSSSSSNAARGAGRKEWQGDEGEIESHSPIVPSPNPTMGMEHPNSTELEHSRAGASQFQEAGAPQLHRVRASQYWSIPAPWTGAS